MKINPTLLMYSFVFLFFNSTKAQYAKYINPFIGTGGTGHTFPGATTPFAMVQLSPDTRIDGSWEGCSGYHYNDSIIYGFSHTHLSGTGCSDYGDIAFMPYFSKTENFDYVKNNLLQTKFSHKNEKASAGYYSVVLDDIPVKVELTATTRTGFQRYTFNEDGYGYIVLNLKHRDELLQGKIQKSKPQTYKGIRVSKAWAKRQELYFATNIIALEPKSAFSVPHILVKEYFDNEKLILCYKVAKGQIIQIKTGISSCDEAGAENNLNKENSYLSFDEVRTQAQQAWENELKKIEVQDAKLPNKTKKLIDQLTTFYTAMYHCMIHPSIMNDVDGRYKGRDGKIHKAEGFNYYTVFSLWDTHRALHPLLNIIDKKRSHDFVITFLKQFEQSGRLPMWELWNNETDCMIGFHSVSVILDAYRKQVINKEELQQLWPAVKAEAMSNRFGLDKFREKGYLSVEDESESVSKTTEYSYDMWCVSEIAKELEYNNAMKYFRKFEDSWQELQNPETGCMQPRKNGNWLTPFNPYEVTNNYTEANAWQYSFYHPHQNVLSFKLDSLFIADSKPQGRTQADITGMIGQYAHGNEPSHNYIYLLNNENRIKYLKYVYDNFYTNKPDGLIGNEDCGQMSAWYVMSALGFYQTCPGEPLFKIGQPIFQKSILNINNDLPNEISTKINRVIEKNKARIPRMIIKGQDMEFDINNELWRDSLLNNTYVETQGNLKKYWDLYFGKTSSLNRRSPLIVSSQRNIFNDSLQIQIINFNTTTGLEREYAKTYYQINDGKFIKYQNPFSINSTSKIKSFTVFENSNFNYDTSNLSTAHFYKRPHNYSIQLNCKYNKQYSADGDDGIIDGQHGDIDWKKGGWQGYQAQDFEAIIDMKEIKSINEISVNFLQDTRSWILFPTKVEFYTSVDNKTFELAGTVENKIAAEDYNIQTQKIKSTLKNAKAQFIKVKAYNFGKLPQWHAGKGDDAFIFIDEIEIK